MKTKYVLQSCITEAVSIITGIVEYDFFYYTNVFVFLYSFDKEICCRRTKLSEKFKMLKYKKINRLWDQRKEIMISDGQTMKSSCLDILWRYENFLSILLKALFFFQIYPTTN